MPSVMQRVGTPNAYHNLNIKYRSHLDHVDPELSKYNEVVRHKTVEEIYAEKLDPAFHAFNERQKRKDRRLDVKWNCTDALSYQRALDTASQESKNKIDQKGRPPIREIVWQIGNPEQGFGCYDQTDESRELAKELLLEVQSIAEERYPQLAFGDVVFHADEVSEDADGNLCGSFHLHASFVPLCYQNKQGMTVQVAFERCLQEMGFSTFVSWKHDLDQIMEDVLQKHGLERTVMENTNEHQDSKEFHRQQEVIRETKRLKKEQTLTQKQVEDLKEERGMLQEQISNMNEVTAYIASDGRESIKAENMTMPAKKSLFGRIEAPERVGVFVENMSKSQVETLMQRVKADERIEDTVEQAREYCGGIVSTAKEEAQAIKAEATEERNETIAKAMEVIRNQQSIIAKAKAWAEDLKKKYKELAEKVQELLGIKTKLEAEVSGLKAQKEQLEPLRAEVKELQRAKDILTGSVENEITQSRFYEPRGAHGSPDEKEKWRRLDKGELLALYKDGQIRTVTRNPQGGMDYKTLEDERAGLCRIGWFKAEERIIVPRNLLKELISVRDETKPITRNLENMISQQNTANRVITKVKEQGLDRE